MTLCRSCYAKPHAELYNINDRKSTKRNDFVIFIKKTK